MNYSDSFKERVKREYPDNKEIQKLLDSGGVFLGRYLDDGRVSLSGHSILEYIDLGDIDALEKRAKAAKERDLLYKEWGKIYDSER